MSGKEQVTGVARDIFVGLRKRGSECAILHHFEMEDGGDIDFCCLSPLDEFLTDLSEVMAPLGWDVIQVFEHERSAAYIVCRSREDRGRYLYFDYCADYRARGHLVLAKKELLAGSQSLPWGGTRVSEEVELKYRFSKAAVKGKNSSTVKAELAPLWERCEESLRLWLRERWQVELKEWTLASVSGALAALAGQFKTPVRSLPEVRLKLRRILKPRGLVWEGPESVSTEMREDVSANFRSSTVSSSSSSSIGALKGVFGSRLVMARHPNARFLLKLFGCYLQSDDSREAIRFLKERTARYAGWTNKKK